MLHSSSRALHRRLASLRYPIPPLSAPFSAMATPAPVSTAPSSSSTAPPHKTRAVFKDGKYSNPWPTWHHNSLLEVGRMLLEQRRLPDPLIGVDLATALPVLPPTFSPTPDHVTYTWLGHATAFVQLYGLNILIDPVFSQRCGPTQWTGPKRLRPVPCSIADLPPIDVVLISHNHYDHLDWGSCQQLVEKAEKQREETGKAGGERVMRWYVGEGIQHWLTANTKARKEDVTGLTWWDEATHTLPASSSSSSSPSSSSSSPVITSVPCQHWSVRSAFDAGKNLWTGFVIQHKGYTLYYSGDTAYCPVFSEIGSVFGSIDLVVLPIAAYTPNWFMKVVHTTPEEAVQVMEDVRGKKGVAVHWGTFVLAAEPLLEPKQRLEAEVKKRGWQSDSFVTTNIGETLTLV